MTTWVYNQYRKVIHPLVVFLSKLYIQFTHMTTIPYTILYYQDCTSLTIGLTYYRGILYIYIYIYHLYLLVITWHFSFWFNAMCQCLVEHKMLSPLWLHPHFIRPCMFMTNISMTCVIKGIVTHVKLAPRVRVRVHKWVVFMTISSFATCWITIWLWKLVYV